MKKRNLLICLILAAALCLAMGTASSFAETYTADKAPEVKLGETFKIDLAESQESQAETQDVYAFKFIPEKTGSYKFSFDSTFDAVNRSEDEQALLTFGVTSDPNSEELDGPFVMCMSTKGMTEEELKEAEEGMDFMRALGITFDDPTFTADLKKGKTYYMLAALAGADSYTSNVTITEHTHDYNEVKQPATYTRQDGMDVFESGGWYVECKDEQCYYHEDKASYPAVNTIELSSESLAYNGKARKPSVTITDMEGNKLRKGKDYTVEYKNNTEIGKAKVVIKFKGGYEGKYTSTFKIVPTKAKITKAAKAGSGKVKVTWNKAKYTSKIDGYQIRYSTTKTFEHYKTVTVKGAKNTSKVISKLKAGKRYYFKVRAYKLVGSKKFCSDWSGWRSTKVRK